MEKKYLTIKEASKFLEISSPTLRNWDKSGKFLAGRHIINNYRLYKLEDLEKLKSEIDNYAEHRRKPMSKRRKLKIQYIKD